MGIDQRQQELVDEFAEFTDWEDRYRRIIELGRDLPGLSDELKQDKFRLRGCQSQVWLHAALEDGERVVFRADSDAMIVRGLIALLLRVYSDSSPHEILHSPPRFISDIGLDGHLSPMRTNGLRSLVEQMVYYARAFDSILTARAKQPSS